MEQQQKEAIEVIDKFVVESNNYGGVDRSKIFCYLKTKVDKLALQGMIEGMEKPKKYVLLTIDKSGSMSGDCINSVKFMLNLLIPYIKKLGYQCDLQLFCTKNEVHESIHLLSDDQISAKIESIKAEGGTNFTNALNTSNELINKAIKFNEYKKVNCIWFFLTDGQINDRKEKENDYFILKAALNQLTKLKLKGLVELEVHGLGIGSGHDAFLMESIVNLKSKYGSFQFAEENNDEKLIEAFQVVKETVNNYRLTLKKKSNLKDGMINEEEKDYLMEEVEINEENITFEGFIKINQADLANNGITLLANINEAYYQDITIDNLKSIFKSETIETTTTQPTPLTSNVNIDHSMKIFETKLKLSLKGLEEALEELLSFLKDNLKNSLITKKEDLARIGLEKANIRLSFQKVYSKIFRIRSKAVKQNLIDISTGVNSRIQLLEELLSKIAKGQVQNELVAKINELSYANINSKKLKKVLMKRATASADIFNDQDQKLEELASSDLEDLLTKLDQHKDPPSNFDLIVKAVRKEAEESICFLSCNEYKDCLRDNDCLCLSFSIKRLDENVIAQTSSIVIENIFPTVISATSFLNAVRFVSTLEIDKSISGSNEIVKGTANEYINACIPMYINELHWKSAYLLSDRLFGWICTLDIFGFDLSIKKILPFVLVEHFFKSKFVFSSEFSHTYFLNVLATVGGIIKNLNYNDYNVKPTEEHPYTNLTEEINYWASNYSELMELRMPEFTVRTEIYLLRYFINDYLHGGNDSYEHFDKLYFHVFEEEVRRSELDIYEKLKGDFTDLLMFISTKCNFNVESDSELTSIVKEVKLHLNELKSGTANTIKNSINFSLTTDYPSFEVSSQKLHDLVLSPIFNIEKNYETLIDEALDEVADLYFESEKFTIIRCIKFCVAQLKIDKISHLATLLCEFKNQNAGLKKLSKTEKISIMLKDIGLDKFQAFTMIFQNFLQLNNSKRIKDNKYEKFFDVRERDNCYLIYTQFSIYKQYCDQEKKRNLVITKSIDIIPSSRFRNIIAITCMRDIRSSENIEEVKNLFMQSFAVKPGAQKVYFCILSENLGTPLLKEKLELFKKMRPEFMHFLRKRHTYRMCYYGIFEKDWLLNFFELKKLVS